MMFVAEKELKTSGGTEGSNAEESSSSNISKCVIND